MAQNSSISHIRLILHQGVLDPLHYNPSNFYNPYQPWKMGQNYFST